MVWDYNDHKPTLKKWEAEERFGPARILGHYNIPHCVWGTDALTCHEVPTFPLEVLEILVPSDRLQDASNHLQRHLRSYKPQTQLNISHERLPEIRDAYKDVCVSLKSTKDFKFAPNYIVLIPDRVFYFDTRDKASTMHPPPEFWLGPEFSNVRVPTYSAFLDALLTTNRMRPDFSMSQVIIDTDINLLVGWKLRFPMEDVYETPDHFPPKLKDIRDGLKSENVRDFESLYALETSLMMEK